MSMDDLKKMEQVNKPKISEEEINIREQIEAYHIMQQELSKEIEENRKNGEDVSILEDTLKKNKEEYERLSKSLDKFE